MTRISKSLVLGAFAALAVAVALVLPPASRAAVSPRPALKTSFSAADVDFALQAFDSFRNRAEVSARSVVADAAVPLIQGERSRNATAGSCAGYTWPHIPAACQVSAERREPRQVRTIAIDATAPGR
jgi:hypothetical protein